MDVLSTIGAFLVVIVFLVLVHELGHFAVAKWSGITVQEFGVGFPPRIASLTWHGTRYSINWIPLGGFVKMLGEDGEVEADRMREDGLSEPEIASAMAGAFNRRPVPIRLLVLVAGVAMNFVLAAALFAVAVSLPERIAHGPVTVTQIQSDSPADGALQVGDVVVAANGIGFESGPAGQRFVRSGELTEYIRQHAGQTVSLSVVRDGSELRVPVRPRVLTEEQRVAGMGPIGFSWEAQTYVEGPPRVDQPLEALAVGTGLAAEIAYQIPGFLAHAIGGLLGLAPQTDAARGPIGIAQITGEIVLEQPLRDILFFVGLLSVNLAVLNILPFPPLDGGRIAVVLVEVLRRRKLGAEREALIYLTGFAVLIALVILISIQDVRRLLGG